MTRHTCRMVLPKIRANTIKLQSGPERHRDCSSDRVCEGVIASSRYSRQFSSALAYVSVLDENPTSETRGIQSIGSAFHIGNSVFVTTRHVIERKTITKVATTARAVITIASPDEHAENVYNIEPRVLTVVDGLSSHKIFRMMSQFFELMVLILIRQKFR